jgi:hypothetical protein
MSAAGKHFGLMRPETKAFVSTTARGLPATANPGNALQDIPLKLALINPSVLILNFLNRFPGIVIFESFPRENGLETKLIDRAAGIKSFASQVSMNFWGNPDKDFPRVFPHFNLLLS